MLAAAFMLLLNNTFLMLRLGSGMGSFPRTLTAEEERGLVTRWLESGDLDARNELIEHNLRLVAHIIKKYYTQTDDADDLISIGTVGLIKGVGTYRPDKGVRLATYASKCIENEILMFFRAQKKTAGNISLSESLDADGDGNSLSFMDIISEEEDMLEQLADAELCERLRGCISRVLTEREETIVRLRYGLGGAPPLTQREVAKSCGISRSYVSHRHYCK